jgi:hypothetical protein
VLHSLIEAHKCLSAGANFATVVMCRRLVETILKDKGVSNKDGFKKAIQSLISNYTVHESMMHLVVLLELVGNMEVSTYELNIKDEQAKETYELTKTLIDMVYLFPKLLERKKENINEEDDFIF